MKKIILYIQVLILCVPLFSQTDNVSVSGYIYDSQTRETLIGANVFDTLNKKGTISNAYGFYSFTSKNRNLTLEFSYIGYQKQSIHFLLNKDTTINIYLVASTDLEEVVITDKTYEQRFVRQEVPGKLEINPQIIAKMPTLTGETDLLKAVQMLPGVKSGTEGTTGLYVRGGNADQNLYLIDGIEVYNPNHLMGFISAFNTDAIKNIEFYKGGFPSEFGGRASSVMDIRTKDGNNEKIKGDFSIGLISAKLNIEGPIKKDKTTFSISMRRTYLDLLLKPLIKYETMGTKDKVDFGYHFYDINAKIKHRLNVRNTLTFSIYKGNDKYKFSSEDDYMVLDKSKAKVIWGNTIATLDWGHQFSSLLFSNFSISYNRYKSLVTTEYDSKNKGGDMDNYHTKFDFNSGVEDITFKNNYNFYLNGWNSLNFGINYIYHHYTPEITKAISLESGENTVSPYMVDNQENAHEFVLYMEDIMNFTENISLREGLRFDYYRVNGVSYKFLQPRFSARYSFRDNFSVKIGYAMMNQNIHLLTNGLFALPTDLWVPVTSKIKPIVTHQISGGIFTQAIGELDISVEGYYKWLYNVIDYKDGVSSFNNSENWQEKVAQGDGKAYGVEFTAQKNKGHFSGWIAYTLSWNKRLYKGKEINNGYEFYDRFDVRHQFNAVVSLELTKHWEVTAAFVINSGSRTNIAVANYYNPIRDLGLSSEINDSWLINVYGERNNFRMPSYQRLDLSLAHHKNTKRGERIWSLNIYNAYNHKNAFFVFPSNKPNKLKAYSIMPIIPTISYSFKFK